jgi:hypothetical protein
MKADTMTTTTTAAAPVCANGGNTGAGNRSGLYLTIDARWDTDKGAWLLLEREDSAGGAWDCLECDHQTPVRGPAALFPYGATLPNDRHLTDAAPALLAALQKLRCAHLNDCYAEAIDQTDRAIAKATGA